MCEPLPKSEGQRGRLQSELPCGDPRGTPKPSGGAPPVGMASKSLSTSRASAHPEIEAPSPPGPGSLPWARLPVPARTRAFRANDGDGRHDELDMRTQFRGKVG